MTEQQYKDLLIATAKMSDYEHKDEQEPVRQAGQQHVPADRLHRQQSHLQNFVLTL